MAIAKAKRTRDATASRAAILDAALKGFSEHGFHGARVEEIARAAGVAKGTVFLHFKNKEGLLLAIVEQRAQSAQQVFAWLGDKGRPPRERLEALVDVHKWVNNDMADFRRRMIAMWHSLPAATRKRLEEFIRQSHIAFRDTVAGVYRELLGAGELDGVKVELIAAALLACVDGLISRCQIPAAFPSGNAVADAAKLAFVEGLERRAAAARDKGRRKPKP